MSLLFWYGNAPSRGMQCFIFLVYRNLCLWVCLFLFFSLPSIFSSNISPVSSTNICLHNSTWMQFNFKHLFCRGWLRHRRLWLSWESGRFQYQRSTVKIQSLARFFLKIRANPGLLSFIFVLFTSQFNYKLSKCRWCAWDSNPWPKDGRHRQNHGAITDFIMNIFTVDFWKDENEEKIVREWPN